MTEQERAEARRRLVEAGPPTVYVVMDADGQIREHPGSFRGAFKRQKDAAAVAVTRHGARVLPVIDVSTIHSETGEFVVMAGPPPWEAKKPADPAAGG